MNKNNTNLLLIVVVSFIVIFIGAIILMNRWLRQSVREGAVSKNPAVVKPGQPTGTKQIQPGEPNPTGVGLPTPYKEGPKKEEFLLE